MPFVPDRNLTVAESDLMESKDGLSYLGVLFDTKMNWSANTRKLVNKAKQAIGALRRSYGIFFNPSPTKNSNLR